MTAVIVGVAALILGGAAGFLIRTNLARSSATTLEGQAQQKLVQADQKLVGAQEDAARTLRKAIEDAKVDASQIRRDAEEDVKTRRDEVARLERRISETEDELRARTRKLDERVLELTERDERLQEVRARLEKAAEQHRIQLERVAGMTSSEAREQLLASLIDDAKRASMAQVREIEQIAREEGEERARKIVTIAIQRVASEQTAESTVSVFTLPSEDMKGRIIGREGRNIRALEHLTGVDFIIDDTPNAVVLSSFDGIRREVARMTLQKLIEDGRIHPSRIEEMYYQSKAELDEHIHQAGQQAVFEANCGDFNEELVKVLGRLRYRTSYGQNVLKHTLEVVQLAGIMAAELEASPKTAKRAALLHDIGKAMTHEVEGSHATISTQLARRYGESPAVCHAIEAHHYEVQPQTVEAVLLIAADAISASRPGARGENLEHYVKRLEKLEELATSHPGVEKAYALQAGREIRVLVKPAEVDDDGAVLLSHEIAREIEGHLEYPGQIKVTVIRESRAVDFAT